MISDASINEFIDWTSGANTYTGVSPSEPTQVSGRAIRELLQNRLKTPFVVKPDDTNNKYRMFSSEEAYQLWSENPSDNQQLELFNFAKPSDYKLELTARNSDGFNNKYVKEGTDDNSATVLDFIWRIYNDEGDSDDGCTITYTITNENAGTSIIIPQYYNNSDTNVRFNISKYLQSGNNNITISAKGNTTGARNSKSFFITIVTLDITSRFKYYQGVRTNSTLDVPYTFNRSNGEGTAKIYVAIDQETQNALTVDIPQSNNLSFTGTIHIPNDFQEGKHTLQMWAEAKYNNGNTDINSNLLYYQFVVKSSQIGSIEKYIPFAYSVTSGGFPINQFYIQCTQHYPVSVSWGYYTDSDTMDTKIPVTWKLIDSNDQVISVLSTINANSNSESTDLNFIPTIYTQNEEQTYLAAYYRDLLIDKIRINISRNTQALISETDNYEVKMSAYGKTNDEHSWEDYSGNVNTTFTNIQWNDNSGWYNNSFRTFGSTSGAVINTDVFGNFDAGYGKTIEIEFESEKISDTTDKVVVIGNSAGARIEITPDTATLYANSGKDVIHTNYKYGERIKLAFIINGTEHRQTGDEDDLGLVYVVNNGILERGASSAGSSFQSSGPITIGFSNSGIRIYAIRVYNFSITYQQAFNNYLYDSINKIQIYEDNNIVAGDEISFDLCKNKIDTIVITGDLSTILNKDSDKDSSETNVTIERFSPTDSTRNFKILNAKIRKHGQSTLNYPISSMKFWMNKSTTSQSPTFEIRPESDSGLNKNRYIMKSINDSNVSSIPANKFILQANYADSSGVHNGGLLRLIQKTWFDAKLRGVGDSAEEYKLRTAPQLFSTRQVVHHKDTNLGEDEWTSGYGVNGSQWLSDKQFPYKLEVAPDSFPCVVFYCDTSGENRQIFLGQYVFMEDKKSDFNYGERSIYNIATDPFCLTELHKSDDTNANLGWDNKDVLRIEVVGSNTTYTSYMSHDNFTDIEDIVDSETNQVVGRRYRWEKDFELIYPDEEDLTSYNSKKPNRVIDKFDPNSEFVRKVTPFINFHQWLVDTRNDYLNTGTYDRFRTEAGQHLDLYKIAAYYIFALRFGLVDSLERNAQLKTYDGQHWHYEPWDMDIALGNKNDGGIAYNPPIDRNTMLPGSISTFAFSGKSADENTGDIVTSNWLFDALEAWPYWVNNVVKPVAQALWNAGLRYNEICHMFDDNYASAWNETIYNKSGHYKYVEAANGDISWLNWLQGARMSHRHWWLSTSMDYYDAKWNCGDYRNNFIYVRANTTQGSTQNIRIIPSKPTYMSLEKDGNVESTQSVTRQNPFEFNMGQIGSNTKNPITIYGSTYMEEIDLSEIAGGLDGVSIGSVYSEELGSPLKNLNLGVVLTASGSDYTCTLSNMASEGSFIQATSQSLQNLQSLNIRGRVRQTDSAALIRNNNISQLSEFLSMGSGLVNFYSSQDGNDFSKIELPDTIYTFDVNNTSWDNLEFWHAETESNVTTLTKLQHVPYTLKEVHLLGTTGSTQESILFVKDWIANIQANDGDFSEYTLEMDNVRWTIETVGQPNLLTYEELSCIAQMTNNLNGYVVLSNEGVSLSTEQLTSIINWFGEGVFTKNSSGLVVDHYRNYVQINVGGDAYIEDGNIYLKEGDTASLNATQFSLSDIPNNDHVWTVGPDINQQRGKEKGCRIVQPSDSADGMAYLTSEQSQGGVDYSVIVAVSVDGTLYHTTINIIAAKYPSDLFIDTKNETLSLPRFSGDYIEFYSGNIGVSFFVNSNQQYSATIRYITYTVERTTDNATLSWTNTDPQIPNFVDPYIDIQKGSNNGIRIDTSGGVPQDFIEYTITAKVVFTSAKEFNITKKFIIGEDTDAIVASSQVIFNAIAASYLEQFGQSLNKNFLYKIDLLSLTGTLDFSTSSQTLLSLNTYNDDTLFKYTKNITGINISNCTNITSNVTINGQSVNQMDLSGISNLQTLNIINCSGLTSDVDLTQNTNIQNVQANGTSINVLIPDNSKITSFTLNTPSSIRIVNPTSLQYNDVSLSSWRNLTSVEIKNAPGNSSYKMFFNIIKKYADEFRVGYYNSRNQPMSSTYSASSALCVSNPIDVSGRGDITVDTDRAGSNSSANYFILYDVDGQYIWSWATTNGNITASWVSENRKYILVLMNFNENNASYIRVIENSSQDVLFEWRKCPSLSHLVIEQGNNVENVPQLVIESLYSIAQNIASSDDINLTGNLSVDYARQSQVSYLTQRFSGLTISVQNYINE